MATPKLGLAAELAKQAAQAARDELAGAQPAPAAVPRGGWQVPTLPRGFALDSAVHAALGHATTSLNRQLGPEGLVVQVPQGAAEKLGTPDAPSAQVRERDGGKIVRQYDALALLKLYASQRLAGGVVVDGQV
jgi:hypothetical protein